MSVRTRTRITGAVAVVATATAALTLLPGTANAATRTPAVNPLTVKSTPAQRGPLMPGGKAKTFDFTVTNHSAKAVTFVGELSGAAHGALPMDQSYLKVAVRAVHAPATASMFGSQDGGFLGAFYPKAGQWGSSFKIPAHASYTWKVTVAATKAFPINDDRLELGVGVSDGAFSSDRVTSFHIGPFSLHTGGPIVTKVSAGDKVSRSKPLVLNVEFTNRTGAALGANAFAFIEEFQDSRTDLQVPLAFDLWNGKRWVSVGQDEANLTELRAGWANGASVSERIRIRVVGWNGQAKSGVTDLGIAPAGPFAQELVRDLQVSDN